MSAKTKNAESKTKSEAAKFPLFELSRRVILASFGAVSLAQDELEAFVDRLVERGGLAEQEGKSLLLEIRDRRKQTREKMKQKASQRINKALSRIDVPTRQDMDLLHAKIDELTQKIDALEKE